MMFSKPGFFIKGVVATMLCVGTTAVPASASVACQPGSANCVLPVTDAPVAPPPPLDAGPPIVESGAAGGGGVGIGLVLAALAAAGLLAFVVFDDDDETSPI